MDTTGLNAQFFDEAGDLLADLEARLVALDPARPDAEELNAVFRAVHSIKGGAGALGFDTLQRTAHAFETLLDAARRGSLRMHRRLVDDFLEVKDALAGQLDAVRQGGEPDAADVERTRLLLETLTAREITAGSGADGYQVEGAAAPAPASGSSPDAATAAGPKTGRRLQVALLGIGERDRASLVDELGRLGQVERAAGDDARFEVVLASSEAADDILAVLCFIAEPEQLEITELAPRVAPGMAGTAPPPSEPRAGPAGTLPARPESATLRVPVAKVDQIINLVGELIITRSMLADAIAGLDAAASRRLAAGMALLERNARDLQDAAMSVRMVAIESVFSRFPRIVRDLAGRLGKQVELVTRGHATELDKSLTERLIDPLTHLVRNALDHGIEAPADRAAAGKPRTGVLTLSAEHRGGRIVIEVSDDGAGLDRAKILAKARERGLVIADDAADDDVWQLVFAPGFSTAAQVSEVSGRGVGMDVVRRNVEALGGHVEISSRPGRGATTRVVLPLTLAVLDGMLVRAGPETFVIPLEAVVESRQVSAHDVYTVAGGGRLLKVREDYLSIVPLRELMGVPGPAPAVDASIAVVVEGRKARHALLVDALTGQQQVVVKNLRTHYRRVRGVAAATILGDGSVALILDVNDLNVHGDDGAPSAPSSAYVASTSRAVSHHEHERIH